MIKAGLAGLNDIKHWETPRLGEANVSPQDEARDLEALRKEAQAQGFAEGHSKGLLQAQAEMNRRLQTLDMVLNALAKPYEDINQQAIDSLAKLSGKIARCLVKRELRTEPEAIIALVRDTVAILNSSAEKLNVFLNPEDAQLIQTITRTSAEKSRWKIIDDPLIPRGDCRVTSRDATVDGSLMARINTIITQFQGDERG
ncbi:MAG: FliH/SctL family protein [Pseudomonadota bacterium]|nr:FliH/SctL family protein [Pseudomonadota bacterium]